VKRLRSVCTLANHNAADELVLMLRSLDLWMSTRVFVACDRAVERRLQRLALTRITLVPLPIVEDELAQADQVSGRHWRRLMDHKMDVMEVALRARGNTLFVDADMLFLAPITDVDLSTHDVALSPHMIRPEDEAVYGRFNGGYVGTSRADFPGWWRRASVHSKYMEQGCLEDAPRRFRVQRLGPHHNYGWWRLDQCGSPLERLRRLAQFRVEREVVRYGDRALVSVHTHLLRPASLYRVTNELVDRLLARSADPRHQALRKWVHAARRARH
jgi:hypothetical protein